MNSKLCYFKWYVIWYEIFVDRSFHSQWARTTPNRDLYSELIAQRKAKTG